MKLRKRTPIFLLCTGILLGTTGCADDNLSKGIAIAGLAGLGSYVGGKLIANKRNRTAGYVLGAAAGGLAGAAIVGGFGGSK